MNQSTGHLRDPRFSLTIELRRHLHLFLKLRCPCLCICPESLSIEEIQRSSRHLNDLVSWLPIVAKTQTDIARSAFAATLPCSMYDLVFDLSTIFEEQQDIVFTESRRLCNIVCQLRQATVEFQRGVWSKWGSERQTRSERYVIAGRGAQLTSHSLPAASPAARDSHRTPNRCPSS